MFIKEWFNRKGWGKVVMKRKIVESLLVFAIVILFILPVVSSITIHPFSSRDIFNLYHRSDNQKTSRDIQDSHNEVSMKDRQSSVIFSEKPVLSTDGLMNSSWPMYCHDVRHTGQSPYNTINTAGVENWRISLENWVEGSPVIDKNGIIYIGGIGLFAIYPNGTLKWNISRLHIISAPAIDEDGIIYVGTIYAMPNYLYAFYPNGTLKWKYLTGDSVFSSPVIGNDRTIYFGQASGDTGYINALYPDGTLRWRYHTSGVVYSSPVIGSDSTVYCGSHDNGLYALYPNNGTMKWRFGTGSWIRTAPCIAEDGTIYCVSLDNYLYAVYQNGTMKWRTDVGAGTSPTIGQDGTVYAGWSALYAVNPINGSIKWTYNPGSGRVIEGATPAHSADGTIYFGVCVGDDEGGEIIAINSDGTEKWRATIADERVESAPAISEDGTVYIGSSWKPSGGFLHAFGPLDPNAPTAPTITGQTNGNIRKIYTYTFTSTSPLHRNISYLINWGDGTTTDWIGPYNSGYALTLNHSWQSKGTFIIQARAKDTDNLWGSYGTLSVTMPCSYDTPFMNLLEKILERFPNAFPILRYLTQSKNS